ncbi:hypothetical protein ZHAS_00021677 [Anopheles sinensis]|uniref:Uncharacterized protein n=1 Tax=Anopheles sinensis TaxID=74873 RepID=A0A084WSX9_ANOSI|nr:hypothetical protein ZHAS_00021677 [Anopheles sinensis]
MHKYGNCIKVYLSNRDNLINITIQCHEPRPIPNAISHQCPRNKASARWLLPDLRYLQYDDHRFELSSCAMSNLTHSYHGRLLLVDDVVTGPGHMLPKWREKLAQRGMVPFTYNGNCDTCSFRNDYVGEIPHNRAPKLAQVAAEPERSEFCKENTEDRTQKTVSQKVEGRPIFLVALLCFVPVLLAGGLMLCLNHALTVNNVEPTVKA